MYTVWDNARQLAKYQVADYDTLSKWIKAES